MPPVNTTPDTATVISALPFSLEEDPQGGADSTYIPSCESGAYRKPLWFTYTPAAGETAFGLTFDSTDYGGDYNPTLSIWTGTIPSLTQVAGLCLSWAAPTQQQISVTPGVTYYFQFTDNHDTDAGASLTWTLALAPMASSPSGALMVSNDTANFPAVILSPVDGSLLRVIGFPAFECADILPDGTMAVAAEDGDFYIEAVRLYNATLTETASVTSIVGVNQYAISPIRTNGSDLFYVATVIGTGTRAVVHTLTSAGDVGATSWTLPSNGDTVSAMAPSRDDAILYYGSSVDSAIHRYDLVNDTALTDLVADAGLSTSIGRDMYVMADGSLLVIYHVSVGAYDARRYNTSTGALITSYTIGTTVGSSPRAALGLDDPDSFWVMTFPVGLGIGGYTRFQRFDTATGAVLTTFDVDIKDANANNDVLYGPSQSCPLLVLPLAITVASTPTVSGLSADTPGGQPSASCADTTLVITGTGFVESGIAVSATRNGTPVTVTVVTVTTTEIVATVDGGFGGGRYCVTVTNDGGGPSNQICAFLSCTPSSDERIIRRLRQSPHVSDTGERLFHNRFQVDFQPGIGTATGQGVDPQVMIQWSDDGGFTWSSERWVSIGAVGRYLSRVVLWRLGQSRDRVYRVTVSDPVVAWVLAQAFLDVFPGLS